MVKNGCLEYIYVYIHNTDKDEKKIQRSVREQTVLHEILLQITLNFFLS